ncbi:MAG: preprotein translocase subunit SecG, partial [Acidimicrobiia bacterium]
SLALIFLILLHAGRGGGVSDMFGGGMSSGNITGSTVVERNLDRLTVVIAISFALFTMWLTWLMA